MRVFSLFFVQLALLASTFAHITGIIPGKTTYHATTKSSYTVTFKTVNSPTTAVDFSVVFGLRTSNDTYYPHALGYYVKNYDLEALGKAGTGSGNFSLKVPIHADQFIAGAGTYTLTAAVTSAFGAAWGTQLEFFNTTFAVTI